MMAEINDYNKRQIEGMQHAIASFLSDTIPLHDLVGTISFLIGSLDHIREERISSIRGKWELLEIVVAEIREQGRLPTQLEKDSAKVIAKEIHQILELFTPPNSA